MKEIFDAVKDAYKQDPKQVVEYTVSLIILGVFIELSLFIASILS
jgi:hypothetical protein